MLLPVAWSGDRVVRVLAALADGGEGLTELVGRTADGRADLRGFRGRPGFRLRSTPLHAIDFSGADLWGWRFHDAAVDDCDFTGSDLRDSRWFGTRVSSSRFERCRLEGAALCTRDAGENSWARCSFARASFGRTTFLGGTIQDCAFDDVRLREVTFDGTRFIRSRFSGTLQDVVFDAPRDGDRFLDPDGLDLRAAHLVDAQFLRHRSNGLLLPPSARMAVLESPAKQLPKAIKRIGRHDDLASRQIAEILMGELRSAHRPDQHVFINLDDLAEFEFDARLRRVLSSVKARFLGPQ